MKVFCVNGVEPQTADTCDVNESHFVAESIGAAVFAVGNG
jgi:hypothetical protein